MFNFPDRIDVHLHGPGQSGQEFHHLLFAMRDQIMSQLSEAVDLLKQSVDAAAVRTKADLEALKATVAELQAKVDAGAVPQAEIDRIMEVKAVADTIDPPQ